MAERHKITAMQAVSCINCRDILLAHLCFTEDSCLDLGALVNGVRYGESLTVNARVNYECKRGYRLVGSPTLTCLRGGTWDHDKPTCQVSGK